MPVDTATQRNVRVMVRTKGGWKTNSVRKCTDPRRMTDIIYDWVEN